MATQPLEAIVIGGSVGSLEGLGVILSALPRSFPMAVAVVVHLPASKPSLFAEVLSARTVLPVKEAEDKEPVAPGRVFLGPPDYHLLIERDRTFALSMDEPLNFSRPSIDVLFESAAEAYGSRLAGIVLSGASEDGARGLAAIGSRGGLVIVQSPAEALVPTLPRAALLLTKPHHVLGLQDIASLLARLSEAGRDTEPQ